MCAGRDFQAVPFEPGSQALCPVRLAGLCLNQAGLPAHRTAGPGERLINLFPASSCGESPVLYLVIADAEVELVPERIADHPTIRKRARARRKPPGQLILDSNTDHRAMASLPDGHRRGRPDITHICLLNALGSIPCRRGEMRVFVHTRNDEVMEFEPETRIPRSQNRFYGILESILARKAGTNLVHYEQMGLARLKERLDPDVCLVMTRRGELVDIDSEIGRAQRAMVIVGGFPRGFYLSPVDEIGRLVRLCDEPLEAWTVVNEVVCSYSRRDAR